MTQFLPSILTSTKRGFSPLSFLCFDIETFTAHEDETFKYQQFMMGYALSFDVSKDGQVKNNQYKRLNEQQDLLEFTLSTVKTRKPLLILSCNIWFDLRTSNLIPNLIKSGYVVDFVHTKGLCVIIKLSKGRNNIQILNLSQLIPGSVKKFGEMLGKPKIEVNLENDSKEKIMEYCIRDTEIVKDIIIQWCNYLITNNMGKFCLTLASQSFYAYRYKFLEKSITYHRKPSFISLERAGYFGGRTECFFLGKIPTQITYVLDVCSMYPWVMRNKKLPNKLAGVRHSPDLLTCAKLLKKYFCVAEVCLDTQNRFYPLKKEGKLIFPIGRFQTVLTSPELSLALKLNDVVCIHKIAFYNQAILFRKYVDTFFGLKQKYTTENNKVFRYVTKILLNSLYGKFGQKMDETIFEEQTLDEQYYSISCFDEETGTAFSEFQFGQHKKRVIEGVNESNYSFPIISAAVTAYARKHILDFMMVCGLENVYYCDTDSIFTNKDGLYNLRKYIKPNKLGYLELQKESESVEIKGNKDYVFSGKETIKGISKLASKVSEGEYNTLQFPGFKAEIRRGLSELYGIRKMVKRLTRNYTKGTKLPNGFVSPLEIYEW